MLCSVLVFLGSAFPTAAGISAKPCRKKEPGQTGQCPQEAPQTAQEAHNPRPLSRDVNCSLNDLLITCKLKRTFQVQGSPATGIHSEAHANTRQIPGLGRFVKG